MNIHSHRPTVIWIKIKAAIEYPPVCSTYQLNKRQKRKEKQRRLCASV